jgi:hypothetical protein
MLTDLVNVMLGSAGVPYVWWGEAIIIANIVLNTVVTKNAVVTPYEGWNGRKSNVNFLRT